MVLAVARSAATINCNLQADETSLNEEGQEVDKADRHQALKRLYSQWAQYDTWDLDACGCLVAGIDPSFPLNAMGPLAPIEDTSISTIDALIRSAAGASLETLEADPERVLRLTFIEWAKAHLNQYVPKEFRLVFFGESDKSIAAGLLSQKPLQIRGLKARRNRLREFLEAEGIKTDPLSVTKEELHQQFYKANPDIFEVKLETFKTDLKKLKIKGKAGRPESF